MDAAAAPPHPISFGTWCTLCLLLYTLPSCLRLFSLGADPLPPGAGLQVTASRGSCLNWLICCSRREGQGGPHRETGGAQRSCARGEDTDEAVAQHCAVNLSRFQAEDGRVSAAALEGLVAMFSIGVCCAKRPRVPVRFVRTRGHALGGSTLLCLFGMSALRGTP